MPDLYCDIWVAGKKGNRSFFWFLFFGGGWRMNFPQSYKENLKHFLEEGSGVKPLQVQSVQRTTGLVRVKSSLTRKYSDADGALLVEWLHRRMIGQAGVLSFFQLTHLLQRQRRGRQEPVTTLRGRNGCKSVKEWTQNVLLVRLFKALQALNNANKWRWMEKILCWLTKGRNRGKETWGDHTQTVWKKEKR